MKFNRCTVKVLLTAGSETLLLRQHSKHLQQVYCTGSVDSWLGDFFAYAMSFNRCTVQFLLTAGLESLLPTPTPPTASIGVLYRFCLQLAWRLYCLRQHCQELQQVYCTGSVANWLGDFIAYVNTANSFNRCTVQVLLTAGLETLLPTPIPPTASIGVLYRLC